MAFSHPSAASALRTGSSLSADNSVPERHLVIDLLRKAAPLLGLKAPIIATLDAMLSCLPPKRTHHTVFASNATLTFRRNGISDRTIRRHVALLQNAGLLERHDSPNRKRFMRSNTAEGAALRFGFDLTPLFNRLTELAHLAAEAMREAEQIAYLKCKLRTAIALRLAQQPDDANALFALGKLRCKLTALDLQTMLEQLEELPHEGLLEGDTSETKPRIETVTSGNDGQNVRHHHTSNKELNDKKLSIEDISVNDVVSACPQTVEFSPRKIETESDIIAHARSLAPMIGIKEGTYELATRRMGPLGAALAVWIVVQFHKRIRNGGAYFRSITCGSRAGSFNPASLIARLATGRACTDCAQ